MSARRRRAAALALAALVVAGTASSCSSGGSDPEETGPTKQAVEQLRDYGLTAKQAACVVDEIGADTVVEATDLNALADSQQYRDAAKACIDGS